MHRAASASTRVFEAAARKPLTPEDRRVIYYFRSRSQRAYLLDIYPKGERVALTRGEALRIERGEIKSARAVTLTVADAEVEPPPHYDAGGLRAGDRAWFEVRSGVGVSPSSRASWD